MRVYLQNLTHTSPKLLVGLENSYGGERNREREGGKERKAERRRERERKEAERGKKKEGGRNKGRKEAARSFLLLRDLILNPHLVFVTTCTCISSVKYMKTLKGSKKLQMVRKKILPRIHSMCSEFYASLKLENLKRPPGSVCWSVINGRFPLC